MTEDLQIVRYGELVPCRTAFIDAHTPGSDKRKISPLLEAVYQNQQTSMYILRRRPALI